MKKESKSIFFIILASATFLLCYLFTCSQHIFIADEVSYINRLLSLTSSTQTWTDALNGNEIPAILADYPLGTSIFLVPFKWVFGYQGIYFANLFYIFVSIGAIYLTLKTVAPDHKLLCLYPLLCIPMLFYSHLVMSELPSLMLISLACYFYFSKNKTTATLFLTGLAIGLAIWFRETNAIILAIPLIDAARKEVSVVIPIALGFLVGVAPRLISAQVIYNNAFYLKDSGYRFSVEYFSGNISLYIVSLIFLFPLILYPLIQVKTTQEKVINGGIWLFIFVHLLYGYNGVKASGIKAILLTSRFLIPVIPLFVISLALVRKQWMPRLLSILPWLAIAMITAFHLLFTMNNKQLTTFKSKLTSVNSSEVIFLFNADDAELLELLTPLQANQPLKIADINQLESQRSQLVNTNNYYLIEQRRSDTENRKDKQAMLDRQLNQYFPTEALELIHRSQNGYQELILWKIDID